MVFSYLLDSLSSLAEGFLDRKPRVAPVLWHLEKQNDLLTGAYRSLSHELHKLQVEEEMLMHKFYVLMQAQGLAKQNKGSQEAQADTENGRHKALIVVPPKE